MSKESSNTTDSQAGVIASAFGGATVVSSIASTGVVAGIAVVAAPVVSPLIVAFGVGYAVSEAWNWLKG